MAAEDVDLLVSDAWPRGGTFSVNYLLDTRDVCEHCLCRIAAEVSFLLTGDANMKSEMLSCRPPGHSHLMPDHEVLRSGEVLFVAPHAVARYFAYAAFDMFCSRNGVFVYDDWTHGDTLISYLQSIDLTAQSYPLDIGLCLFDGPTSQFPRDCL